MLVARSHRTPWHLYHAPLPWCHALAAQQLDRTYRNFSKGAEIASHRIYLYSQPAPPAVPLSQHARSLKLSHCEGVVPFESLVRELGDGKCNVEIGQTPSRPRRVKTVHTTYMLNRLN